MLAVLVLLILSLALVIKSSDFAIRYSVKMAESFNLPKYVIGFIIVAIISILPEAFISITAATKGIPVLGLGTLFGSNVADLTLVFALVVLVAGRPLKVESKIIKNGFLYLGLIVIPIIFGLNGYYSRAEGLILIILGLFFYFYIFKTGQLKTEVKREKFSIRNALFLLLSMGALLLGAHLTVKFGVQLADYLHVSPILIGLFIVGLGTTLPELFFSIRAAKHHHDDLALGDILGTVIADATILVGIIATIAPFAFNLKIIYGTGLSMIMAIILLLYFMKTDRRLSRPESFALILFYLAFVAIELFISFQVY